jgi:hypothetical protein
VRAGAAGEQAEAVEQRRERRDVERVGHRLAEPAVHPGADPAQHDAGRPRLREHGVEAVRAPDGEQAGGVAAADVDDVLLEHERAQVRDAAVEQPRSAGRQSSAANAR